MDGHLADAHGFTDGEVGEESTVSRSEMQPSKLKLSSGVVQEGLYLFEETKVLHTR